MTTKYLRMIAFLLIILVCFIGVSCLLFGTFVVGYLVRSGEGRTEENDEAMAMQQVAESWNRWGETASENGTTVLIYSEY